ncbi:MAG: hypothetical protein H7A53_09845 [Akkermansiaceae bacterium]|nr:hypothetical protein [Akkermansiaceae bacterium]
MIDDELGFLVAEHGFSSERNPSNDFERTFARDQCVFRVLGGGYGENAWLEIDVDGKHVPWYLVAPNMQTRMTPATDAPQLDDIRDIAARAREYFRPLLTGDYSIAESAWARDIELFDAARQRREADPKGTFFSDADRLWKNKKWSDLVTHLASTDYKLSKTWNQRFDEARTMTNKA